MADITFGEWLKRRRKGLGLTQRQLALRMNCSTVLLKKLEAEERQPSHQIVERLADIFNIPADEQTKFLRFARGDWQAGTIAESQESPWRDSAAPPRSNLPASLTSFIGRESDLASLSVYLRDDSRRLITLAGPPGIGKTRLSIETARSVLTEFADGVFFVALAPVEDPSLIAATIVHAVGYVQAKNQSARQQLAEGIGDRHMLLVLDNCEHLIEAVAPLVSGLLSACPRLKILATSRETLRVGGEWVYIVPTLDAPEGRLSVDIETASAFPAVALFTERARAVRSGFVLNADNLEAVSKICNRLEGLPLAIELIAARIRLMPPKALLERLSDPFIHYANGMRASSARQKTLHHAIDWSYSLLSEEEQKLFVYLSVFSGGFTLQTAESVFSQATAGVSIPDLIALLLDKSLLQRTVGREAQDEPRYHMLVTIQHFARERLHQMGMAAEAHLWHFDYFLGLAEAGVPHMTGHGQLEWLLRLQAEMDNFRSAFEWNLGNHKDTEKSLRLANALFPVWRTRSDFQEAQHWLDLALNLPDVERYPSAYARGLLSQGILKLISAYDPQIAKPLLAQSIRLARASGDQPTLAEALDFLGLAYAFQKKFDQAHVFLKESQNLFRMTNDRKGLALTNWHLGWIAEAEGNQMTALEFFKEALLLCQEVGDILRQSILLRAIGQSLFDAGERKEGLAMLRQALGAAYEIGSKLEMGHAFLVLSLAEEQRNNFTKAARYLLQAQKLYIDCGAQGHLLDLKSELGRLQNHLDPSELETAIAQAKFWTLEQAVAYVLEEKSE